MNWIERRADAIAGDYGIDELRRLSELRPEPVETVTRSALTADELREATRMVHEALGVGVVESCAECDAAFARHGARVSDWTLPELDSPAYHSEAAERLRTNGFDRTNRGANR